MLQEPFADTLEHLCRGAKHRQHLHGVSDHITADVIGSLHNSFRCGLLRQEGAGGHCNGERRDKAALI